jgi:hypothetical protein
MTVGFMVQLPSYGAAIAGGAKPRMAKAAARAKAEMRLPITGVLICVLSLRVIFCTCQSGDGAPVSTSSKSWVMAAVLAIMAEAEQYFSADSAMARSTLADASPRPLTTKCR